MVYPALVIACLLVAFKNPHIAICYLMAVAVVRLIVATVGSDSFLLFFMAYSIGAAIITLMVDKVAGAIFATISLVYLVMVFGVFHQFTNQVITEVLFIAGLVHGLFAKPDRGILAHVHGVGPDNSLVHMAESQSRSDAIPQEKR